MKKRIVILISMSILAVMLLTSCSEQDFEARADIGVGWTEQ